MGRNSQTQTVDYIARTNALLERIKFIPKLTSLQGWNLEGDLPKDSFLYFISSTYETAFQDWADFKKCRSIKLVNLGKPACRLTFFITHKYWLKKPEDFDTSQKKVEAIQEAINYLQEELSRPLTQFGTEQIVKSNRQDPLMLRQELADWIKIRENPEAYQLTISNYEKERFYNTVNYKYLLKEPTDEKTLTNETVHLLRHQYEDRICVEERYNIIFIDELAITEDDPYQNKKIHTYLASFPTKLEMDKQFVYARPIQGVLNDSDVN